MSVRFLRGSVRGELDSTARLTLFENGLLEGTVSLKNHSLNYNLEVVYYDETGSTNHDLFDKAKEGQLATIAYRSDDVELDELEGKCDNIAITDVPNIFSEPRLQKRSLFNLPQNPDCAVGLVADITAFRKYGQFTATYMLSILNDVQGLYMSQLNLGLPVRYIYVVTSANDTSGLGQETFSDPNEFLRTFAMAAGNNLFPNFDSVSKNICLMHMFTARNFQSQIGLAYVGQRELQPLSGACTKYYNTGYTTSMIGMSSGVVYDLTRFSKIKSTAHELGHGLGAIHDTDYPADFPIDMSSCNVVGSRKLMHPALSASNYSDQFSPCSLLRISERLEQFTCLVPRGTLTDLAAPKYADSPNQKFDQCTALLGSNYVECPIHVGTTGCELTCVSLGSDVIECKNVVKAGSLVKKRDGSVCGFSYPKPNICVSGQCVPDTRAFTCDRTNPCCDAMGYLKKAGTPCTICSNAYDTNSCVTAGYACGIGDSLGLCVPISNPTSGPKNNRTLCAGVTCTDEYEVCLTVSNTPFCFDTYDASCRYLCGNPNFEYQWWDCDCLSDCKSRNSCCADYDQYCVNTLNAPVSSSSVVASTTSSRISSSARTSRSLSARPSASWVLPPPPSASAPSSSQPFVATSDVIIPQETSQSSTGSSSQQQSSVSYTSSTTTTTTKRSTTSKSTSSDTGTPTEDDTNIYISTGESSSGGPEFFANPVVISVFALLGLMITVHVLITLKRRLSIKRQPPNITRTVRDERRINAYI